MSVLSLKEMNLIGYLPRELRDSLLCFTYVNSKVIKDAPDIVICNANGYMYEIKNKKILLVLNIMCNASSLSCYYLPENKNLVVFYLVLTADYRLLIIRRFNEYLKIVASFDNVKGYQVYDFKCLGFPQIELTFLNDLKCSVIEFPVEHKVCTEKVSNESPLVNTLMEELEELHKHIDELTEEYNQLRRLCFPNDQHKISEKISISSVGFSSHLNEVTQHEMAVSFKWFKVFSSKLALGMKLCNVGNRTIHDIDIIINHEKIHDYAFSVFQFSSDISSFLFSPAQMKRCVQPGEEIFAVGTFEVPTFYSESNLFISCSLIDVDSKDCLLQEIFDVNIKDIAAQSVNGLDARFTVEDLLAIKTIKSETRLKVQTEDVEDGFMESALMKHLGFEMIKHVNNKLFYCTSTYLKEVFVALQHVAVNPSVWNMVLYTSDESQIYFFVNALYELLPENTEILCDENAD